MKNTTLSKISDKNTMLLAGVGGAAFIVGLIIGLVVLGWWLWPVKWINASPANLQESYQSMFLQSAVEAFACNSDANLAKQRFATLGEQGKPLLEALAQKPPQGISIETIQAFADAVGVSLPSSGTTGKGAATPAQTEAAAPKGTGTAIQALMLTPTPQEAPSERSHAVFRLVSLLCGIGLIALILAAILIYWKSRQKEKVPVTAAQRAQAMTQATEATDFTAEGREEPLTQFMTTYVHGDDLFDDSFSIDSPTGDFLGECGVGITETIGVGEPKRVMAFEIWLFDKNDIQTITKVLMSEHAYNDEATRQRLAAKGDPVMARPGEEIVLETAKLQMRARIADMAYGEDALPESSYFERLTLELAVWPKED